MKMLSLGCLHVLIDNVDNILKVSPSVGWTMKFTYHLSIKSSVDWFGVGIMLKTGALMDGNVS
jgi:hypothetical protein